MMMMMVGVVVEGEGMIGKIKIKIRKIRKISARRLEDFRSTMHSEENQTTREAGGISPNLSLPGIIGEDGAEDVPATKSITRRAVR